jgi:predicted nucleic acid-binding protein
MDAVLLDTDVFSFLNKRGDTRADLYRPHITGKTIALSFVTVGELYTWTVTRQWSPRRIAELEQRLKAAVIVPYDVELCKTYAKLRATLQAKAIGVGANDLWIAACAVRHSLPLVTHNYKHFAPIPGLQIISESNKPTPSTTAQLFKDP